MRVRKFSKTLHIKLDKEDSTDIHDIINHDELFWNDLRLSSNDGWYYLVDDNRDEVCELTSYGYDLLAEIATGKNVVLWYKPNDPEYEWNQE